MANAKFSNVDDKETWRTSAGGVSEVPSFVQITAEVGEWGGNVENANLPDQLMVDYVRVYEQAPYTATKLQELVKQFDGDMEGFKKLLEYQTENELISEKAYHTLMDAADSLIGNWQ